jgi:hypothetical protein
MIQTPISSENEVPITSSKCIIQSHNISLPHVLYLASNEKNLFFVLKGDKMLNESQCNHIFLVGIAKPSQW